MDRREGLWAVRRLPDDEALPLFAARQAPELPEETTRLCRRCRASEHVLADYQTLRLSLKGYPMQFLRRASTRKGSRVVRRAAAGADGAGCAAPASC